MRRVRTGPECPEDNLMELSRDSNPNCGIARERKERERDFPVKSSNPKALPGPLTEQRTEQIPEET